MIPKVATMMGENNHLPTFVLSSIDWISWNPNICCLAPVYHCRWVLTQACLSPTRHHKVHTRQQSLKINSKSAIECDGESHTNCCIIHFKTNHRTVHYRTLLMCISSSLQSIKMPKMSLSVQNYKHSLLKVIKPPSLTIATGCLWISNQKEGRATVSHLPLNSLSGTHTQKSPSPFISSLEVHEHFLEWFLKIRLRSLNPSCLPARSCQVQFAF